MKPEYIAEAIGIISKSNSITVSFNVPVSDNYTHTYAILIHQSNASVIEQLTNAGFSLSMNPKGLAVDKF
ncbi:hypothetical protein [Muribaculum intestinale]|uniref:HMA domain-containing protein n=1 Tax=Muribaculum intestinale TaxID=1796646 RepID=A0A4S2FXK9_9BACT|nr:hypothetical protein [Muribaculum intestinale]MYM12384.1 hypothetical protein [Muribaculum intestinale]TGY74173.1 hypothetical protein E5333_07040 [Muribaculum intestinale]